MLLPALCPSGEMVDAADSKSVVERRVGSSPTWGTKGGEDSPLNFCRSSLFRIGRLTRLFKLVKLWRDWRDYGLGHTIRSYSRNTQEGRSRLLLKCFSSLYFKVQNSKKESIIRCKFLIPCHNCIV